MKHLMIFLFAVACLHADDSFLKTAKLSGNLEYRFTDFPDNSVNKDSFVFDNAHVILENNRGGFEVKIDALWTDATSTTELEEAWIQWNTYKSINIKVGRFVNSSIWNDNRYVTEHTSISAPEMNDDFIPVFSTGVQFSGDLGSKLDYVASIGNGKDSTKAGDNNDSKALFLKATWKLQDKNLNGLWLSAAYYNDTKDVVARVNDYTAYQYETGFKIKAINILGSYATSTEEDAVLGDIKKSSWYVQPSITVGKKATLYVRWEDFGVKDVIAAGDKEVKTIGLNFKLNDDVVFKVETKIEDFDMASLKNDNTYLFSLGMKF